MAIAALKDKAWYVGLGAGVAVALVLFLLAWWRLYSPMKDQIAGQDAQLSKLQEKIQEGRAAKQRLPQFREEVRRLELELDKLLRILPARLNTEDLLRRLRALAEQGDLDILRSRSRSRGRITTWRSSTTASAASRASSTSTTCRSAALIPSPTRGTRSTPISWRRPSCTAKRKRLLRQRRDR
jgi:type IV pilus assembly PilO-like protein